MTSPEPTAHGARTSPSPVGTAETGCSVSLREPCGTEDPIGSRRNTPATKRTKAGEVTVYTTSKRLGDIVSEMYERVENGIGLLQ